MSTQFTYNSTFSGIGGFELGFDAEGAACVGQVEIDKNRQKVLDHHWPNLLKGENIDDVHGRDLARADAFIGGFPCQDTSSAAPHRRGLKGKRSSKYHSFQRLLGEYLRIVDENDARWVVIENPAGLLKSNGGRDMSAVVAGLEELGYGWAYRVVDGRYTGAAQRRERVLIVGHRGGDPRPAWAVLGDPDTSEEAGGPHQVRRSARGPKAVVEPDPDSGLLIYRKSARARASLAKGGYETWVPAEYTNTLTGFDYGGALRQTHLVAHPDGRMRTFTLTEWERLQGFPDGWTDGLPEFQRATMLGDAMCVPMARWLGRRLIQVHQSIPMIQPAEEVAA